MNGGRRFGCTQGREADAGVAIMTDTDNKGEIATAYYGDIFFKRSSSRE
jgi:hypothetical protein